MTNETETSGNYIVCIIAVGHLFKYFHQRKAGLAVEYEQDAGVDLGVDLSKSAPGEMAGYMITTE